MSKGRWVMLMRFQKYVNGLPYGCKNAEFYTDFKNTNITLSDNMLSENVWSDNMLSHSMLKLQYVTW
jgi:hypothetical protein